MKTETLKKQISKLPERRGDKSRALENLSEMAIIDAQIEKLKTRRDLLQDEVVESIEDIKLCIEVEGIKEKIKNGEKVA